MSRSRVSAARALALGSSLALLTLMGGAVPVAAQDEVCDALSLDELEAALGVPFEEGFGFEGYCSWEAETETGRVSVALILEAGPLAELRDQAPGGQDLVIGGAPAYAVQEDLSGEEGLPDSKAAAVAVASDDMADAIYLESSDPGIDVLTAAIELMGSAAPRLAAIELPVGPFTEFDQPPACDIFDEAELGAILGQSLTETEYSQGSCAWESDAGSTAFASVSLSYDSADLSELKMFFPGGEDLSVAELPAYLYTFEMEDSSQASLALDLGPETATLSIISPDPGSDASATAVALMGTALERGLTPGPEPSIGPSACSYLTAEEVAAAIGSDLAFEMDDMGDACSYFGGEYESAIELLVTAEDPETLEFAAESLGAVEVSGIGDRAWWSADLGVLYAVQGDQAFSAFVSGAGDMDDETREAMARAVMEALLARS